MRFHRYNLAIIIALILTVSAFTSFALAGGPQEKDQDFLYSDPDRDEIPTWMEFLLGTDPYNSDSDNDGLPDLWEYENYLDPADSSDAHLDFDYLPSTNFSEGESAANFDAVQTLKSGDPMLWPGTQIKFIDPVFEEDGPHYDNYEEYYRPYTVTDPDTGEEIIKIMKTDPNDPNTDGDEFLDPDDYEPFNFKNDGTGIGGTDAPEIKVTDKLDDDKVVEDPGINDGNKIIVESNPGFSENNYDIEIEQSDTDAEANVETENYPVDTDNDGI